jgi:type IV pilus assembly protein PilA
MVQKLRERSNGESGFTLVELLVVMLILGLLAAIAIPAFFNQRDKAHDADAKATAKTAQTAMETYATDNDGNYTGVDVADLNGIEPTLPDGAPLAVSGIAAQTYTVTVTSESGDGTETFSLSRDAAGEIDYACSAPGEGGCPSDSDWS